MKTTKSYPYTSNGISAEPHGEMITKHSGHHARVDGGGRKEKIHFIFFKNKSLYLTVYSLKHQLYIPLRMSHKLMY